MNELLLSDQLVEFTVGDQAVAEFFDTPDQTIIFDLVGLPGIQGATGPAGPAGQANIPPTLDGGNF